MLKSTSRQGICSERRAALPSNPLVAFDNANQKEIVVDAYDAHVDREEAATEASREANRPDSNTVRVFDSVDLKP